MPYPVKGARFTIEAVYLDADGDPLDPTTPDSEFSLDNGAFADCAEEVTLATGGRGAGILTLTGAETNGSCLKLWLGSANAKPTLYTLYPRVLSVLFSVTATAGAAGSITLPTSVPRIPGILRGCVAKTTGGTGGGGTGGLANQARVITAFSSAGVATIEPNWETTPDATTTVDILLTEAAQFAGLLLAMLEPTAVPSFTAPLGDQLMWIFTQSRNKITQSATQQLVRNDADTATLGTAAVSDDGTTFVRGEFS